MGYLFWCSVFSVECLFIDDVRIVFKSFQFSSTILLDGSAWTRHSNSVQR